MKAFLRILPLVLVFISGFFGSREVPVVVPQEAAVVQVLPASSSSSVLVPRFSPVIRVIDGDTVIVLYKGVKETVRLIGLDTPETVDPRKPVQCFGEEASARARQLLEGGEVRLEFDPSQAERDRYGRLLGYLYLKDGTLLNERMIEEGYGHEYTYRTPYQYKPRLAEAERRAREAKRGLWNPDVCGSGVR